MKIGLVTYTPQKVEGYDLHVTTQNGQMDKRFQPLKTCKTTSQFSATQKPYREDPTIVAVSNTGPALRKSRKFNLPFDYVCPTNPVYRTKVLDYIESLSKEAIQGVTLNLYHFPDQEFCVCPRCVELWKQSGLNWTQWRAQTVTKFVSRSQGASEGNFCG